MKPDYKNWVPRSMINGFLCGTAIALILFILFGAADIILHGTARLVCAIVLGIAALVLLFLSIWLDLGSSTLLIGRK